MSYLGIFVMHLKRTIVTLEISKIQNFKQQERSLDLGPKILFWLLFERNRKNNCYI